MSQCIIIQMIKYLLILVILTGPAMVFGQTACSNIPADGVYYLTSFCDKVTSCGKSCGNCTWYYAADKQRFGCGATLNCMRAGKSVNMEVIDYGPDCELQKKSGKPIIDASYSACKFWTGGNSCGWSDRIAVTCKKVASPRYLGMLPLGPCSWEPNHESLPFCHLPQNKHKYTFENIEEWTSSVELPESLFQ